MIYRSESVKQPVNPLCVSLIQETMRQELERKEIEQKRWMKLHQHIRKKYTEAEKQVQGLKKRNVCCFIVTICVCTYMIDYDELFSHPSIPVRYFIPGVSSETDGGNRRYEPFG